MGQKPSNYKQMDRPESGGADHNSERENSGLLNKAKASVARSEKAKHAEGPHQPHPTDATDDGHGVNPNTRDD